MKAQQKTRQNVMIAVWSLATLFFAFLSVLAFIPANTDVEIREEIKVSSSLINAESGEYEVVFVGALRNVTGEDITVERLSVPVNGSDRRIDEMVMTVENFTIPARTTVTVSTSKTGFEKCTKVGEVTAAYHGESRFLRNPAEIDPVGALIPLAFTLIFVFFLVRACKVRMYLAQLERAEG